MELNHRLDPLEKRFAEGWARGVLTKYGFPDKEIEKIMTEQQEMLVEVAQNWEKGILDRFGPLIAEEKLKEMMAIERLKKEEEERTLRRLMGEERERALRVAGVL